MRAKRPASLKRAIAMCAIAGSVGLPAFFVGLETDQPLVVLFSAFAISFACLGVRLLLIIAARDKAWRAITRRVRDPGRDPAD